MILRVAVLFFCKTYFALLAQLVEQLPFKEKVAGSNPARRTYGKRIISTNAYS